MLKSGVVDAKKVGRRMGDIRRDYGYSQKTVAQMIGCDCSCMSRYESGGRELNYERLVLFARALKVDLNWLLGVDNEY